MSSILGSADSLSKSAGGLSAGLQERNRYWILFLEGRIVEVEGNMRASGELGPIGPPARDSADGNGAALAMTDGAGVAAGGTTPVATPAGSGWSWPGFTDGATIDTVEGE